ncbi:hypothetical protein FQZ97_992200 [compost metagenome]
MNAIGERDLQNPGSESGGAVTKHAIWISDGDGDRAAGAPLAAGSYRGEGYFCSRRVYGTGERFSVDKHRCIG